MTRTCQSLSLQNGKHLEGNCSFVLSDRTRVCRRMQLNTSSKATHYKLKGNSLQSQNTKSGPPAMSWRHNGNFPCLKHWLPKPMKTVEATKTQVVLLLFTRWFFSPCLLERKGRYQADPSDRKHLTLDLCLWHRRPVPETAGRGQAERR